MTLRKAALADRGVALIPIRLGDGFADAFGGQADQLYAFRTWQQAGITVAGSSDAPVITPDPLTGIRDAIMRRTAPGQVLGPGESG